MSSYFGIYRAVVVSTCDPLKRRRVRIQVPDVLGAETPWAEACVAPGSRAKPKDGQTVWIQFEQGAAEHPVWVGVMP